MTYNIRQRVSQEYLTNEMKRILASHQRISSRLPDVNVRHVDMGDKKSSPAMER